MNKLTPEEELALAIFIMAKTHLDQFDKGGMPYALHPLRMMMRLRTNDCQLMAICVMHDVIEDQKAKPGDDDYIDYDALIKLGFSERVSNGVVALSRLEDETYEEFISRICKDLDWILCKREDIKDNSDPTRMKGLREKDFCRMEKYNRAFHRLESALNEFRNIPSVF